MGKRKSATSSSDSNDIEDSIPQPGWDNSPNTAAAYSRDLAQWLPTQDRNILSFIEQGFLINKNKTVTYTDHHADMLNFGSIPRGTFQTPCDIDETTFDAVVAAIN